MNSSPIIRDAALELIKHKVAEAVTRQVYVGGVHRSCLSCAVFDEAKELCRKHPEWGRPPARIIAFGCEEYADSEEIPF